MPISSKETLVPRRKRSRWSSGGSPSRDTVPHTTTTEAETEASRRSSRGSPARGTASHPTDMQISTMKASRNMLARSRSPAGSSSWRAIPVSHPHPTWVILNRVGARRDSFHGDHTTSAISHTSTGEQISVSFELVEPPGTSLLTLDWPQGPDPMESTLSCPNVLASDRDTVLFQMTSRAKCPSAPIDYFVYRARSDASRRSSLSRLPICYWKGNSSADLPRQRILSRKATGLLSSRNDMFIVALLEIKADSPSTVNIYMLCYDRLLSGPAEWKVFEDLTVHCSDDGRHLSWWSTDAVLPYCHRSLIWVDYYRGMIFGDRIGVAHKPDLRYVPLPTDPVQGKLDEYEYGRGHPEAFCSLCVTGRVIQFVNVNQRSSSFSITLWSLCEEDYTWTKEATLDAGQLWALDHENCLPHVLPEFPVVSMKTPDTICFLLNKGRRTADISATTWMIEIDMKKPLLLAVTSYSNKGSVSDQNSFKIARTMSEGRSFIPSEMPRYLSGNAMERKSTS